MAFPNTRVQEPFALNPRIMKSMPQSFVPSIQLVPSGVVGTDQSWALTKAKRYMALSSRALRLKLYHCLQLVDPNRQWISQIDARRVFYLLDDRIERIIRMIRRTLISHRQRNVRLRSVPLAQPIPATYQSRLHPTTLRHDLRPPLRHAIDRARERPLVRGQPAATRYLTVMPQTDLCFRSLSLLPRPRVPFRNPLAVVIRAV